MDNRTNTIAGWVLAGCGAALGLSILRGMMFHSERPEKMGYPIEGVEAEGGDGGDAVAPIATRLASPDAAHGADGSKQCTSGQIETPGCPNGCGTSGRAALWGRVRPTVLC